MARSDVMMTLPAWTRTKVEAFCREFAQRTCHICQIAEVLPQEKTIQLDTVYHLDAIELLKQLANGSIDAVIIDPPYNLTKLVFEETINWKTFWVEARRVLRTKKSPVISFSQQPFTTDLINSNRKGWRYEIVWEKTMPTGFLDANRRPLRCHENIQIFADGMPAYTPLMEPTTALRGTTKKRGERALHYGRHNKVTTWQDGGIRYPRSVVKYAQRNTAFENTKTNHRTEKPIPLMKWLIETFTDPGDVILDCFCGAGSTLLAASELKRHFIGGDKSVNEVQVARARLAQPYTEDMFIF